MPHSHRIESVTRDLHQSALLLLAGLPQPQRALAADIISPDQTPKSGQQAALESCVNRAGFQTSASVLLGLANIHEGAGDLEGVMLLRAMARLLAAHEATVL